jgi:hypothetical protein
MDEQRLDPGHGDVAGIQIAIVTGKRDRQPVARQPRASAVIPVGGCGRTLTWRKIVY